LSKPKDGDEKKELLRTFLIIQNIADTFQQRKEYSINLFIIAAQY